MSLFLHHKHWLRSTAFWLMFAVLAAQAIASSHHHEGELLTHPDCVVCLKAGTDDDAAVDSAHSSLFPELSEQVQSTSAATPPFGRPVDLRSRAPPIA